MNIDRGCCRVGDCWNKWDGFEKTLKNTEVMWAGLKGMKVRKGIEVVLQR